jgi:hypothetical protein
MKGAGDFVVYFKVRNHIQTCFQDRHRPVGAFAGSVQNLQLQSRMMVVIVFSHGNGAQEKESFLDTIQQHLSVPHWICGS